MKLELVEVRPIGNRVTTAFVRHTDGSCELEQVELPEYPPNPNAERLRSARLTSCLTLVEGAGVLGLTPVELSALEWGRMVLLGDGYEEAIAALQKFEPSMTSNVARHRMAPPLPCRTCGWPEGSALCQRSHA